MKAVNFQTDWLLCAPSKNQGSLHIRNIYSVAGASELVSIVPLDKLTLRVTALVTWYILKNSKKSACEFMTMLLS